jgi:hypothetical protein
MKFRTTLLLSLLGAAIHLSAQDIIYLETFNYDESEVANDATTAAGWAGGYPGANSDTTLRAANWYSEPEYGKREIDFGTNNHQLESHVNAGAIVQSTDPSWVQFFTTEYTEGTDFSGLGRIEFYVLNDQRLREYHLTILAGGQWYISSESFTTPSFGAVWHLQQGMELDGLSWYAAPVGFAGVGRNPVLPEFALPATATPAGVVTGFGFLYNMSGQGNVVVDNYTVYSAPPPPPVLEIVVASGTDPEISFDSVDGVSYQLQKNSTLDSLTWEDVPGQSVTGDGTEKTLSDPGAVTPGTKVFYRVVGN